MTIPKAMIPSTIQEKTESIKINQVSHPIMHCGGVFTPPGDKSISHRALLLASLAQGTSCLTGFLQSEDCLHTLEALKACGVSVKRENTTVWIEGTGRLQPPTTSLYFGNAGTGLRLFTGLLAGSACPARLMGDASLHNRPMERLLLPLRCMGARIEDTAGKAPLTVLSVPLKPLSFNVPVASAQVKTALLLAGLASRQPVRLTGRIDTRDHLERLCQHWHIPLQRSLQCLEYQPEMGDFQAHDLAIPGDISSAAFFIALVAGWKGMQLKVESVGLNPHRIGFLRVLQRMGANIRWILTETTPEPLGSVEVMGVELTGVTVPALWVPDCIDEFPALCVAAALAHGVTHIHGAEELRWKESDRLLALSEGLQQVGIHSMARKDGLSIWGGKPLGGQVESRGDHRIAMAFLCLGARSEGPITVTGCESIPTSFPDFTSIGRALGLSLGD
jgi:3-phosphoshikimate 1-carboxyvinyltransferase